MINIISKLKEKLYEIEIKDNHINAHNSHYQFYIDKNKNLYSIDTYRLIPFTVWRPDLVQTEITEKALIELIEKESE